LSSSIGASMLATVKLELTDEMAALGDLRAYAEVPNAAGAEAVEVIQTHISVVFLVGDAVFKIKKPLCLPFVDYSTLELRRHFCHVEVELNRRLASDVYRGVVVIRRAADGHLYVDGDYDDRGPSDDHARADGAETKDERRDEVVDYAVEMRRLDEARTLGAWLARGELRPGTMAAIGRRLTEFHRHAARGPDVDARACFDAVATNCRDNYTQTAALHLDAIPEALLERLATLTERELRRQATTIASRAEQGLACDCHGDLRLDHVYLFPEREPPVDLEIIDCVEFNDAFRYSDPIADLAFLVMDLRYHGFTAEADELTSAYFDAADDHGGAALLPLYTAYRASVRGKVEAFRMSEPEVPAASREEARRASLRHLLLALRELSAPGLGPSLILLAGLPGSGKSTLAAALGETLGETQGETGGEADPPLIIRSDVVRKRLAGLSPETSSKAAFGEGIYTPAMTERTYGACLEMARAALCEGRTVLVDANFRGNRQRRLFVALAQELGVPLCLLICEASEEESLARIRARSGDASDADASIYLSARQAWEAPSAELAAVAKTIDSSGSPRATLAAAQAALRSCDS